MTPISLSTLIARSPDAQEGRGTHKTGSSPTTTIVKSNLFHGFHQNSFHPYENIFAVTSAVKYISITFSINVVSCHLVLKTKTTKFATIRNVVNL
jgi:hypothetical protein